MGYVLTAKPTEEPVALSDAKAFLRVDTADDDDQIAALIVAARMHFERETNRALVTQSWRLDLDGFPRPRGVRHAMWSGEPIRLGRGPVLSVDAVRYFDPAGALQTIAPDTYVADLSEDVARIAPLLYQPWPYAPHRLAAVSVAFTSGYGDADDVDQLIKQAILFVASHWYENRDAVEVGARAAAVQIPMSAQAIIDAYTIPVLS